MIAAGRADELKNVGVATFHPALYDTDWLAPNARRLAMAELASKRKPHHDALGRDAQPPVTWRIQASRCGGGT
jgi:nicotinic acid mononucleotide adenylyltransferase